MSAKRRSGAESRWRSLIVAQEQSGLGVAEFADRRGLNPSSLYWWRSHLRRRERVRSRIVPIEIIGAPPKPSDDSTHFEIELGGGRRLRVAPGFDARELARLIATLERAC